MVKPECLSGQDESVAAEMAVVGSAAVNPARILDLWKCWMMFPKNPVKSDGMIYVSSDMISQSALRMSRSICSGSGKS
jgi:hypothetical protein